MIDRVEILIKYDAINTIFLENHIFLVFLLHKHMQKIPQSVEDPKLERQI